MGPFITTTARMSAGVLVWALHFAFVYGVTGLACARGYAHVVPWFVAGGTVVGAVLATVVMVVCFAQRAEFSRWMAGAIAGFAALAIVLEGLPVIFLKPCI